MTKRGEGIANWIWNGTGVGSSVARTALAPAAALFAIGVARRNARFDRAMSIIDSANHVDNDSIQRTRSAVRPSALPAISIGNITVGGTGKTPVAAWCARQLRKGGARPAIVLRGYGDDEWRVHTLLNPGLPVIVSPDRSNGVVIAKTRGANCVVLDDAFQHRQASRLADIVLMSADQWSGQARLLPAGPFREPLSALRRATVVVITAKAASGQQVDALEAVIKRAAQDVPIALVRLVFGSLKLAVSLPSADEKSTRRTALADKSGLLERMPDWLAGRKVMAVSAIGDATAFVSQLEQCGAEVESNRFRDHHDFSAADVAEIVRKAKRSEGVVCTLKDAVKLGPLWPRIAPPLWYVSQSVVVERGALALDRALARVLAARGRINLP